MLRLFVGVSMISSHPSLNVINVELLIPLNHQISENVIYFNIVMVCPYCILTLCTHSHKYKNIKSLITITMSLTSNIEPLTMDLVVLQFVHVHTCLPFFVPFTISCLHIQTKCALIKPFMAQYRKALSLFVKWSFNSSILVFYAF